MLNPGASAQESNGNQPGNLRMREAARETIPDLPAGDLTAELNSAVISAVVIVLDDAHQDLPLLAFAVTDPACQRRRIGRRLIEESIQRLDAIGVKELHLAVTRGNPAFTLYQRLGFEVVPGGQAPEAPDVPGRSL